MNTQQSLVFVKPNSQAFACLAIAKQTSFMNKTETRRSRLRDWFASRSLPEKEKSYLSQLINGKASFGEKAARRLERDYGMADGYLDSEGSAASESSKAEAGSNVALVPMGTRRIPLVSYVQAGTMTDIVDPYPIGAAADWLLTDLELGPNAFALTIKGDSMTPEFREGDNIVVDPAVQPLPGDFVVAKNGENEATFKKYRPRGVNEAGQEVFELVPLNEDYPSMRSDLKPIKIIGTMVEHRRYRRR